MTKEPYSYVVLRYVHDVLTGEFVNVGLVMIFPGRSQVLTKTRKSFGRVKNVFPDLDGAAYKRSIEAINRGMKRVDRNLRSESPSMGNKTALDYARQALSVDDSSLQWSPVGAGLSAEPQKTLEQLYNRLVSRYNRPQKRHRTDDDIWRSVAAKLRQRGVSVNLEPKRVNGTTDSVEFSHAFENGRWNVYEPLSFDLAGADNIKNKARRWLGHLSAVKEGADVDVQVHFIVGRPQDTSLVDAYQHAMEILRRVPFKNDVVEETHIDRVVRRIQNDIRHHELRVH